jgi:hypothetical protein
MRTAPTVTGVALEQERPRAAVLRGLDHAPSVSMLATLLVLLGTGAWLNQRFPGVPVFELLFTLVLLSTTLRLSVRRRQAILGVLLAVPTIAVLWLRQGIPDVGLSQVGLTLLLVFLLYSAAVILLYVLRDETVDLDTLSAAFSVFLLIGFAWSCIYGLIFLATPDAFQIPSGAPRPYESGITSDAPMDILIYYSFVTLTTVGYGDVLPAGFLARGMANLEAVVGHFYLAVLIARLVGLSIAQAVKKT